MQHTRTQARTQTLTSGHTHTHSLPFVTSLTFQAKQPCYNAFQFSLHGFYRAAQFTENAVLIGCMATLPSSSSA